MFNSQMFITTGETADLRGDKFRISTLSGISKNRVFADHCVYFLAIFVTSIVTVFDGADKQQ